jgi:hypothetical protein
MENKEIKVISERSRINLEKAEKDELEKFEKSKYYH